MCCNLQVRILKELDSMVCELFFSVQRLVRLFGTWYEWKAIDLAGA